MPRPRPPRISLADRIIETWVNDEMSYSAYYHDYLPISDDECKNLASYGVTKPQCEVLQGLFQDDLSECVVTVAREKTLENAGFSKDVIKDLSANNGYRFIYAKAKRAAKDAAVELGVLRDQKSDRCDDYGDDSECLPVNIRQTQQNPQDFYRWRCGVFENYLDGLPSSCSLWGKFRPLIEVDDFILNNTEATRALAPLTQDKKIPPHLRAYALEKIGSVDASKSAVNILVNALSDDDPKLRVAAALGLNSMAQRLRELRVSKNVNVNRRSEADDALAKMEPLAAPALLRTYSNTNPVFVRYAVVKAMATLCSSGVIDGLVKALDDPEPDIRELAVSAVGTIGADAVGALPKLGAILRTSKDTFYRQLIITAIGRMATSEGVSLLEEVLTEKDANGNLIYDGHTRFKTVLALKNAKTEASFSLLIAAAAKDPDLEVKIAAIDALGEAREVAAIPMLFEIIDKAVDKTEDRIPALKRGLKEKNPLRQCYEDDGENVMDCFYKKTHSSNSQSTVFKELGDPNRRLAAVAIRALGRIGSKDAASRLIELLDSNVKLVRRVAVEALGDYGSLNVVAEAESALIRVLKDDDEDTAMRITAAWALGNIKSKKAVSILREISEDNDNNRWLRLAAREALDAIQK